MHDMPVSDKWERGNPYERYVGRWSRQVAPVFLSWLHIPGGLRWLDVGCGTGALCAAILDRCSPSSVTGVEPSEGFLKTAKENLSDRVALHQGTATAIPLGDASVDVVVSGLVLNLFRINAPRSLRWRALRVKAARLPYTSGTTLKKWSSCGTSGTWRSSSTRTPHRWMKASASQCAARKRSRGSLSPRDWETSK